MLLGFICNVVVWAAVVAFGVMGAIIDVLCLAWTRTVGKPLLRAGAVGAALLLALVTQVVLKEFNGFLAASAVAAYGRSNMSR